MTVEQLIAEINFFKLPEGEREAWEFHSGDIIINASKWREIKRRYQDE